MYGRERRGKGLRVLNRLNGKENMSAKVIVLSKGKRIIGSSKHKPQKIKENEMEIIRLGGTQRQKGREKTTAFLFQEALKPRQFCRGKTFEKNTCVCLCAHGGVRVHSYTENPQSGLRSARSTVPPPSACAEIKPAALGEPSPKSLCGGQRGQPDFLSERGLRSHPKPPLAITIANFFWAVRPQVLLLALVVAACGSRDGHP